MTQHTCSTPVSTPVSTIAGLDLGDRKIHVCVLRDRTVVCRTVCPTTQAGLDRALAEFKGARVVLEAGSQSAWISRYLTKEGFDVHVVDPRRVQLIASDPRKSDRRDAEMLARLEAGMPELLGNVYHRGEQAQADLAMVRARDQLVRARGELVQCVRGLCKSYGQRLPSSSTEGFSKAMAELVPLALRPATDVMLKEIASLNAAILQLDRRIAKAASERYPEVATLRQVRGVGPVTAIAYVLTIEDPKRFANSRLVGSWLGLCPRSHSSGDSNPQLKISKAGDGYLRRLVVQCAQYILGPFGKDCDLRRLGLRLAARGGRAAKKRAVVAVARKLAVLLHRLWRDQLVYDPLHEAKRREAAVAV